LGVISVISSKQTFNAPLVEDLHGVPGNVPAAGPLFRARCDLGYVLLMQGQVEAAVDILRKVVQAKPDNEMARFELGRALLQQGDATGAIENLEAAKQIAPDRDTTYFQLSQAYRRAGRVVDAQQALAEYQKLIETNRLKRRESLEADNP
jgi:tetratricopeptide (TPR) repeat protein